MHAAGACLARVHAAPLVHAGQGASGPSNSPTHLCKRSSVIRVSLCCLHGKAGQGNLLYVVPEGVSLHIPDEGSTIRDRQAATGRQRQAGRGRRSTLLRHPLVATMLLPVSTAVASSAGGKNAAAEEATRPTCTLECSATRRRSACQNPSAVGHLPASSPASEASMPGG